MLGSIGYDFARIVGDIFVSNGWRIHSEVAVSAASSSAIDVFAMKSDGTALPIEVKVTRREQVSLAQLRDASAVTASLKPFAKKCKPLLVFGASVDGARRLWAEQEFEIDIWDIDRLRDNAGRHLSELNNLLATLRGPIKTVDEALLEGASGQAVEVGEVDSAIIKPVRLQGDALIAQLSRIKAGNPGAKAYERVCRDIIGYLFGDDLRDGRSQMRTTDHLNIYDLIYRVRPQHQFWLNLTRDFRARVVLFECKNYGKSISAMQVFTTERYLNSGAFRPICFVLSRKQAHKHAMQAAFGAMRESGKLLVFLSDDDLCQMLRAKDSQLREGGTSAEMEANDPTEVLDQKIYEFIATMPR